jgi:hypothetical protein
MPCGIHYYLHPLLLITHNSSTTTMPLPQAASRYTSDLYGVAASLARCYGPFPARSARSSTAYIDRMKYVDRAQQLKASGSPMVSCAYICSNKPRSSSMYPLDALLASSESDIRMVNWKGRALRAVLVIDIHTYYSNTINCAVYRIEILT